MYQRKEISPPIKRTVSVTLTPDVTRSFSVPSLTINANSVNNNEDSAYSNNEENLNTKILKSFKKEFKRQNNNYRKLIYNLKQRL
jgi:hypothetical protein